MLKYKCKGSICLIASMSGLVANKGLLSPVYNSSKAAVIQPARCLAMEWSLIQKDDRMYPSQLYITWAYFDPHGSQEVPVLKERWERENMMGRLADTDELKGAALFFLSVASSFMTGNNLVIDGEHTKW